GRLCDLVDFVYCRLHLILINHKSDTRYRTGHLVRSQRTPEYGEATSQRAKKSHFSADVATSTFAASAMSWRTASAHRAAGCGQSGHFVASATHTILVDQ